MTNIKMDFPACRQVTKFEMTGLKINRFFELIPLPMQVAIFGA